MWYCDCVCVFNYCAQSSESMRAYRWTRRKIAWILWLWAKRRAQPLSQAATANWILKRKIILQNWIIPEKMISRAMVDGACSMAKITTCKSTHIKKSPRATFVHRSWEVNLLFACLFIYFFFFCWSSVNFKLKAMKGSPYFDCSTHINNLLKSLILIYIYGSLRYSIWCPLTVCVCYRIFGRINSFYLSFFETAHTDLAIKLNIRLIFVLILVFFRNIVESHSDFPKSIN